MKEILVKMDNLKNEINTRIDNIEWFVVSAIAIWGILIAIMNYNSNQCHYAA